MKHIGRLFITAMFLAGLPALGAAEGSSPIGIRGAFCDTADQLDAMFQGIFVDGVPLRAVLTMINAKAGKTACGGTRLALVNVTLRARHAAGGRTYYFYEGDAVAVATPRGVYIPVLPPLRQHWWMTEPLDPKDKESGA